MLFSTEDGYINVDFLVEYLVSMSGSMDSLLLNNDITEDYINFVLSMPTEYYSEIVTTYGLELSSCVFFCFFNFKSNFFSKISTLT